MAGVIYSPAGPVNTRCAGAWFPGCCWPEMVTWWQDFVEVPEETLQISFHIRACFLFSKFFLFFFFLNAYVFICLVALPWFSVAIPRVFDPCAPWGVLDVACGIQSLDQESSEFYFLLE